MPRAVVGRTGELRLIERFFDALCAGPQVLVLRGEAGIGKTTLLRAAIDQARERGVRVLACTATAAEVRLSYMGLGDLFAGVRVDERPRLPAPQRDALDAALLRSGRTAADADPRAVATAALSVLEALADEGPVLVAIDDAQWLDSPSAAVAEFCARRHSGRVGLLATQRVGEGMDWPVRLARRLAPERIELHRLGPLHPDEVALMLRNRAGDSLDRRTLVRIQKAADGNPFYAVELARAVPRCGVESAGIPLPDSLDEVLAARLGGLAASTEEALLAVACLAQPTVDLLERALGGAAVSALDEAEERELVQRDGRTLRFTHPLLAAGVYARATAPDRRAMHARLSAAVADIEERARHLALAHQMPEAIAALDEAAGHARARGAPEAAAELLELAFGLRDDPLLRVRAAQYHFDAGDAERAQGLLETALPRLAAGGDRAEALLLLAEVHYKDDSFERARDLLEQALEQTGDERLRLMTELRLTFAHFNLTDLAAAGEAAASALRRAERVGEQPLLASALAVSVMTDFCRGRGLRERRLRRALALEVHDQRLGVEFQPSLISAFLFLWTGRLDEARTRLEVVVASCVEHGDEHALAWACFIRTWLECWAGDLDSAAVAADEAWRRLLRLETANGRALGITARAQVDALAGRVAEARAGAQEALELFERTGWRTWSALAAITIGSLDLSLGDHRSAAARLVPLAATAVAGGLPEPTAGGLLVVGDAAEALIATGRREEAEPLVAALEQRGAALDRVWAIAVGARCRGLLLAQAADLAGAERALERALAAHERLPMPVERARTLLALGRIRRRRRRRLAAKAALEEARAIFAEVGCPLWAGQAVDEIAALGLRPGAADRLTPSEERVARLAASGLTIAAIATQLVVSPKTVEAHLGRVYRKLGIHSRVELGARMADYGENLTVSTSPSAIT